MLTTKQLEQINNSEFEKYCKKEYQPFFNYLKNVNANYFFKKKRIIVEFHENSQYKVKDFEERDFFKETDLQINYIEFKAIVFPPNLTIISSKNKPISTQISNYPKTKLPVNLSISNNFIIENSSSLHYFGENTKVDSLIAQGNYLKNLDNITIKKILDLRKSKLLKKLPDNLSLAGSLDISNSSIEELGKNTKIKKTLYIYECHIKEISNLYVGVLYLNIKNLKKIENTTVKYFCFIILNSNINLEKIKNNYFLNELNYNCYGYDDFNKNLLIKNNYIKILKTNSNFFNKIDNIKNIKKMFIRFNSDNNLNILEKLYNQFTNPINHTICFENYFVDGQYYINKNYINCDAKNDLSTEEFENYFKNVLLYHADHILKKKLILNKIDKIDDSEIQKYITKHNTNKNLVKVVSNDKKFKFTKGKIPLIYYCQNKDAFKLLYKNNYLFNEQEFNSIKNTFILSDEMKNLYEIYLLKLQNTINNLTDNSNSNSNSNSNKTQKLKIKLNNL